MMKPTTEALIRLQRLIPGNRVKFLGIFIADLLGLRHTVVRFDPVMACNLRCGLCYYSSEEWRQKHPTGRFTWPEVERIADEFFPTALQVHVGCGSEPTVYKDFVGVVRLAKAKKVPFVSLVTNGQLLTRKHLDELAAAGLDEIVLSAHGLTAATYEKMMVRSDFTRFTALLDMLGEVRAAAGGAGPRLRINYTVCPENIEDLARFFEVMGQVRIDVLQVRPAADIGGTVEVLGDGAYAMRYRAVLSELKRECAARGIALLYNENEIVGREVNVNAPPYVEGVSRVINPETVWQPGFDWRNESYRTYKRRIGFRRRMLGYALGTIAIRYRASRLNSSSVA